ncbi:hypothetical protein NDU88_000673 [Pleurodeles waltl]|uniref:Uncharacterized protein n=1 Tax=Pleurodeles waltl TaxID=8319 RepID=A0AAV7MHH6_PLEWA|nr:hypothetical protein NDU88_000673 [Pleurodeles waltl]
MYRAGRYARNGHRMLVIRVIDLVWLFYARDVHDMPGLVMVCQQCPLYASDIHQLPSCITYLHPCSDRILSQESIDDGQGSLIMCTDTQPPPPPLHLPEPVLPGPLLCWAPSSRVPSQVTAGLCLAQLWHPGSYGQSPNRAPVKSYLFD